MMVQADELLDSLSRMAESEAPEPHIVIGRDRRITIPEELKKIAVQYDSGVETVTFDCPKYWDEHDFSKMVPYVNYVCADGSHGSCPAVNVVEDDTDPDIFHFDWIITDGVTKANGRVAILVCIKGTNDDQLVHWNSEKNDELYISEGLACVEDVIESYPDEVTMLLKRMSELEDIGLSHTITVEEFEGGHKIILADSTGEKTIEVKNGAAFTYDDFTEEQLADLKAGVGSITGTYNKTNEELKISNLQILEE